MMRGAAEGPTGSKVTSYSPLAVHWCSETHASWPAGALPATDKERGIWVPGAVGLNVVSRPSPRVMHSATDGQAIGPVPGGPVPGPTGKASGVCAAWGSNVIPNVGA